MAGTLGKHLNLCFKRQLESQYPNSHPLLFNNFTPLYNYNSNLDSDSNSESEPDFATAFASNRFFFSSPGRSNSIVDSAESSDSPLTQKCKAPISDLCSTSESWDSHSPKVQGSVAVPTYSPDPYSDFRRSMQEMVEARGFVDVKANWDYLHELLLCYLALNPKSTHEFIVRAFADLLVSMLESPPPSTAE